MRVLELIQGRVTVALVFELSFELELELMHPGFSLMALVVGSFELSHKVLKTPRNLGAFLFGADKVGA